MAKMNFELAREIIHDNKFSFMQYSGLKHDDLISCKFVTRVIIIEYEFLNFAGKIITSLP